MASVLRTSTVSACKCRRIHKNSFEDGRQLEANVAGRIRRVALDGDFSFKLRFASCLPLQQRLRGGLSA